MPAVTNGRVIYNSIPEDAPEVGKTLSYDGSDTIDVDTVPLNGGVLLKLVVVSADPYQRRLMVSPDAKDTFIPPYQVGEPIIGNTIAHVVRTETDAVKVGDYVQGLLPWKNFVVLPSAEGLNVIQNYFNLPISAFVSILGIGGHTGYMGWKEYSKAKKGETVFVTGASGIVGSIVIQLAKRDGLKVIASAGSDDKASFAKSIGADVAFNYRTTKTLEVLEREGPIDIYWDNVGGESLDAALETAAMNARFIECGMVGGYNAGYGAIKNLIKLLDKEIVMSGLNVISLYPKYTTDFYTTVPKLVADGEIKYQEDIFEGLERAPDAVVATLTNKARGKAVVIVDKA